MGPGAAVSYIWQLWSELCDTSVYVAVYSTDLTLQVNNSNLS